MNAERAVARVLLAAAVAATLLVALDVGGPIRQAVVLGFVLVAPGAALALTMGPMSLEGRLLVALAGSAAIATVTSLALLAGRVWSGELATLVLAAIAVLLAARRATSAAVPDPLDDPIDLSEPSAADLPDADRFAAAADVSDTPAADRFAVEPSYRSAADLPDPSAADRFAVNRFAAADRSEPAAADRFAVDPSFLSAAEPADRSAAAAPTVGDPADPSAAPTAADIDTPREPRPGAGPHHARSTR